MRSAALSTFPTASPKYNFYGANRKGANLFGDCLLALDARTGKRIWHFQMVHHDIWDYDNATAPKLLTVRHDGKMVDVVAQVGKEGFVWVFNRETGEPLWPIEERPVPRSDMPGEDTWPTQPFPLKPPPFARQKFTDKDLNPFIDDPAERARLRDEIRAARNEGLFTPPGLRNTIEMPGNNGGANFGNAAVDPRTGTLYVVSKDLPAMLKLELDTKKQASPNASIGEKGQIVYEANCRTCHGDDRNGQPPAVPSLVNIGSRLDRAKVNAVVTHGKGQMPAFPKLSEADSRSAYGLSVQSVDSACSCCAAQQVARGKRERCGPGYFALQDWLRIHVHQQRTPGDFTAMDIVNGLRFERGHDQVENTAGGSA